MKKLKIEDLKELPFPEKLINYERQRILKKVQSLPKRSMLSYLIPALSISAIIFILVINTTKNKNIKETQIYNNIYFYQFMDMFEYMDVLENLNEEDLK